MLDSFLMEIVNYDLENSDFLEFVLQLLLTLENGRLSDRNWIVANSNGSDRIRIGRNERCRSPL